MLSTEDSKIKKFEMTLGTEFNAISTCVTCYACEFARLNPCTPIDVVRICCACK